MTLERGRMLAHQEPLIALATGRGCGRRRAPAAALHGRRLRYAPGAAPAAAPREAAAWLRPAAWRVVAAPAWPGPAAAAAALCAPGTAAAAAALGAPGTAAAALAVPGTAAAAPAPP